MSILNIEGLNKAYSKFQLRDVSFTLEKGYIMGFIGANGAGKTTTLKSILNMVQPDSGKVTMFDKDFNENELALKQEIGFAFGGQDSYPNRKLKTITDVIRRFYSNWDEKIYSSFMKRFGLDEEKKVIELSDGMRVKYALVLALSHHAKLFILDEPTSGLDPVARDDLMELFQEIIEDGEKSILFSTHITSDLEKCADYITFIQDGEIIASSTKDELINSHKIIKGTQKQLAEYKERLISYKTNTFGFSGLIKTEDLETQDDLELFMPSIEDIMIYYSKKENSNEKSTI